MTRRGGGCVIKSANFCAAAVMSLSACDDATTTDTTASTPPSRVRLVVSSLVAAPSSHAGDFAEVAVASSGGML